MDTKTIFEEARRTMLANEPLGRTLFVEFAGSEELVIAPVITDDFSTTAAREQAMLEAGRQLGQRFPGDQITELAFVQRGWITKILPKQNLMKHLDHLHKVEVVSMCVVTCTRAKKQYRTHYAEVIRSTRGRVTGLVGMLSPAEIFENAVLDAVFTGYENWNCSDSQFAMMAAYHIVKAKERVSDAWGVLKQ